jgi:hypothetical protein
VLGFAEHQRHCAVHTDTGNLHIQIAYNTIHPVTLRKTTPRHDFAKRNALCRELEREYGLTVDKGMEQERRRHNEKAVAGEKQRGEQSFDSYARERREAILQALDAARSWHSLHEALARYGLEIRPRGNGLVIKNRDGRQAIKASDLDRRLSKGRLEKTFGPYVEAGTLTVEEQSRYRARPIQRSPESEALYARYQAEAKAMQAGRETALAAICEKWRRKRAEIDRLNILKKNRRSLLQTARKNELAELAMARARQRSARPFRSWNDYLCRQAEQGNETALALLRSRKKPVEPEREAAADLMDIRADYAEQQATIQNSDALSAKGKKRLQSFVRMEQALVEERLHSPDAPDPQKVKRTVDKKGAVVFTLPGGGRIRDTGAEVLFSSDVEGLARAYVKKKWGVKFVEGEGRFVFDWSGVVMERKRLGWQIEKGLSR